MFTVLIHKVELHYTFHVSYKHQVAIAQSMTMQPLKGFSDSHIPGRTDVQLVLPPPPSTPGMLYTYLYGEG